MLRNVLDHCGHITPPHCYIWKSHPHWDSTSSILILLPISISIWKTINQVFFFIIAKPLQSLLAPSPKLLWKCVAGLISNISSSKNNKMSHFQHEICCLCKFTIKWRLWQFYICLAQFLNLFWKRRRTWCRRSPRPNHFNATVIKKHQVIDNGPVMTQQPRNDHSNRSLCNEPVVLPYSCITLIYSLIYRLYCVS